MTPVEATALVLWPEGFKKLLAGGAAVGDAFHFARTAVRDLEGEDYRVACAGLEASVEILHALTQRGPLPDFQDPWWFAPSWMREFSIQVTVDKGYTRAEQFFRRRAEALRALKK